MYIALPCTPHPEPICVCCGKRYKRTLPEPLSINVRKARNLGPNILDLDNMVERINDMPDDLRQELRELQSVFGRPKAVYYQETPPWEE